ncbi:tyrosine-type recombinase/integrase [bacterium]|nr:tyrosine-type recombinase/integrase [bacterium]
MYEKSGTYYYVNKLGKWIPLGKTLPDMHRRLSQVLEDEIRGTTLNSVMDRYAREVMPSKAPATQKVQTPQLAHLREVFGMCAPATIRPCNIFEYLQARSAKVAGNREIALLSDIFRYAANWGIVDTNPCKGVSRNKEKPDNRYITDDEFSAVVLAAPPAIAAAMKLAYLTGQRQADLLALHRNQLRDEGIYFKQRKTGKEIIVAWSQELRAEVDAALALQGDTPSMWVIANSNRQRYTSSGFQTAWQKLMRKCMSNSVLGERFTFRAIRAKARSDGSDKQLLGHANPDAMAAIYQRKPILVEPVR